MLNRIYMVLMAVVIWKGYQHFTAVEPAPAPPKPVESTVEYTNEPTFNSDLYSQPQEPTFVCDGRTHCSQMRSEEEAIFFINNCPNTRMDGDHDGEPCEQQFRDEPFNDQQSRHRKSK